MSWDLGAGKTSTREQYASLISERRESEMENRYPRTWGEMLRSLLSLHETCGQYRGEKSSLSSYERVEIG